MAVSIFIIPKKRKETSGRGKLLFLGFREKHPGCIEREEGNRYITGRIVLFSTRAKTSSVHLSYHTGESARAV